MHCVNMDIFFESRDVQVQNRKLSERLRERSRSNDKLQHKLDEEEERSGQYGEVLSVVEAHLSDLGDLLEGVGE